MHDEFEKLLAAVPSVNPAMATLLVLANETGHRINSIRLLRWSDLDSRANTIRWRGEHDKIGHEHLTPLVDAAKAALIRHRARGSVTGDESPWVFAAPEDSTQLVFGRRFERHGVKKPSRLVSP